MVSEAPVFHLPADARVLVVIVARIGDTLLATPILRAIKAALPACRLTVWAHPKRLDALKHLPVIDQLRGVTKGSAFLRGRMPGKTFDAALVFGYDAPLLAAACRLAKRVACFRRGTTAPRHADFAFDEPEGIHAVDHRLILLQAFAIPAVSRRLAWTVAPAEVAWAQAWLDKHLPDRHAGPLLGLQAASFPTKAYRDWPAEHFRELLARFFAAYPTGNAVLFGDEASRERATLIASGNPRAAVLAGQASLRQSAAVMVRCTAYAGVDTGPSHIAGALGLPMVVLYHPLHPGRNLMPLEHPAPLEVIEHPALDSDRDVSEAAMAEISVDTVWKALQKVLAK